MTKLEEKLKELGYEIMLDEKYKYGHNMPFIKKVNNNYYLYLIIWTNAEITEIKHHRLEPFYHFTTIEDADFLKEKMIEMQRDLKELRECQD